jgi:hypothetical protein
MDEDVISARAELFEVFDLRPVKIHQVKLLERRHDSERVERAARDQLTRRFQLVNAGACEGIDVDVADLRLLGEDGGVRRRIVLHDVQLELRPVPDLIELQTRWRHGYPPIVLPAELDRDDTIHPFRSQST